MFNTCLGAGASELLNHVCKGNSSASAACTLNTRTPLARAKRREPSAGLRGRNVFKAGSNKCQAAVTCSLHVRDAFGEKH